MSDHSVDTSREAVERKAAWLRDFAAGHSSGVQGALEGSATTLRALLSRAERAEAERDAHWQTISAQLDAHMQTIRERDAARAEAEMWEKHASTLAAFLSDACDRNEAPGGSARRAFLLWRADRARKHGLAELADRCTALAAKEPGHLAGFAVQVASAVPDGEVRMVNPGGNKVVARIVGLKEPGHD